MMHFKDAIKQMIKDGEFEKVIAHSKGRDRKSAKEFYSLVKDNPDIDNIPAITLLIAIHSPSVLRDAITYMEMDIKNKKD
jgi:hypothetical protein